MDHRFIRLGWLWVKEIRTTGAKEYSVGRFGRPEDCLQDARSHGLLEGHPLGGECVQRHDGPWHWRVIGPGGSVDEESTGIYSTEDDCLANARANAMGWEARDADSPVSSADEHRGDDSQEGGDAVHNVGSAEVEPHANEVNIGSEVDGGASGDVAESRVCSVASSGPFWKIHRRKALWVQCFSLWLQSLARRSSLGLLAICTNASSPPRRRRRCKATSRDLLNDSG